MKITHTSLWVLCSFLCMAYAQEKVGQRPYEMDWAGRTKDFWPPLVDFEASEEWSVETVNCEASFRRTREQQLFGDHVTKLSYRYGGNGTPSIILRPPAPLPVTIPFDMIGMWIYGNNWFWEQDPTTPQANVNILFKTADGREESVFLCNIGWKEWFLPLVRLTKEQEELLNQPGTVFSGIKILNGVNKAERLLFFDNLSLHKEQFNALSFSQRPKRGIDMFPGQDCGLNTGRGRLPFPNREDTILPDSAAPNSTNTLRQEGDSFLFTYEGDDGCLRLRYTPKNGQWSDIQMQWNDQDWFFPLFEGGARFPDNGMPDSQELLEIQQMGQMVKSTWRCTHGEDSFDVSYTLQMKGKTLILDTCSIGGHVGLVSYGAVKGLVDPRAILIPYYNYSSGRPGTIVSGSAESPLFFSAHTDWYRSNASKPIGRADVTKDGLAYSNGGVRYVPKTDGKRNDCFERFFITLSPRFEETLPNIPNPVSPWKHVAGVKQWRAHGAENRENDKRYWRNIWRHGMREVLVTDHETCWRDGGESFTFRTKAAPGKGGDEGMADYSRFMQEELGFTYGPYNNFTDFAPVNEYWNIDLVSRTADNQLQSAWARCYGPKPSRAVEFCEKLSPINQRKFHFSTAYCDVHTAVTPWERCDYDFRVPGAGTFAATFYAYGEIMMLQKNAWNGPVYSEGPHFCFYSGLTDGNYAQDANYRLYIAPWLVDFDLRKIHDHECNFGMGAPDMFYQRGNLFNSTEIDAYADRFFAATLAFGHPGFLFPGAIRNTMRGYFMLQQLHSRYTLTSVDTIGYVDAEGHIHDTSSALARNVHQRSQLVIRYQDGTRLAVNGNLTERMTVDFGGRHLDLPPNGYAGWTEDGTVDVLSADDAEGRFDVAVTPEFLFIDGRDGAFRHTAMAAASGCGVCRRIDDDTMEFIPLDGAECGWKLPVVSATALDKEMNELGPAALRRSRGYTYVLPVEGAFSYLLKLGNVDVDVLACPQSIVFAGQSLTITAAPGKTYPFTIPADAAYGQRFWFEADDLAIDFTVQPRVGYVVNQEGDFLAVSLFSHDPELRSVVCEWNGGSQSIDLPHGRHVDLRLPMPVPEVTSLDIYPLVLRNGDWSQSISVGVFSRPGFKSMEIDWKDTSSQGICIRNQQETSSLGSYGSTCHFQTMSCGNVAKTGIFLHPPYSEGVGYSFICKTVTLPADYPVMFKCSVGKQDGSYLGDGIWFRLNLIDKNGKETQLAENSVQRHEWKDFQADLTPWQGQNITLKLISDVGPNDNSEGDWACWGDLRIETKEQLMLNQLVPNLDQFTMEADEGFVDGVSTEELRKARRGWLCYEGIGLDSNPLSFQCTGSVNGVSIGPLAAAGGNELKSLWSKEIQNELPPEAIVNLNPTSYFELQNPRRDCFKLRRFRILLELADGRRVSSRIVSSVVSQPFDWLYSEGICLPFSEDFRIPISFK